MGVASKCSLKNAAICAFLAVCGALTAGPVESTVMVAGFDYGVVMKGTGSGFVIAPETVVTAGHCTKMGDSMRVETPDGKWYNAKVLRAGSPDWAVLSVPGLKADVLPVGTAPANGERVTAYGRFPNGLRTEAGSAKGWTMRRGWDFCTSKVYPGYSGGPVCDRQGRVVGVTSMTVGGAGCLYVPISAVRW